MRHNVIFIIAVLLSWAGLLRAADDGRTDCVTALPVQVVPGGQAVLQLWLQGDDGYEADGQTYRSLQFDLVLPKGVTLIENQEAGEYQYSLGDLFSTGTNVSITLKEGEADANRYRFIIYNVLNTRFTAPSGSLLSLWLQADADVPTASQLTATIEGQILGQTGDTNVHAASQPITLTTAGYVKGERGRGVYSRDFNTSNTGRTNFGSCENILVAIDQTEARQKDNHPYRSAQFDLHLPKGIKLQKGASSGAFSYSSFQGLTTNHEVSITEHEDEDGTFYRVILYSLTEKISAIDLRPRGTAPWLSCSPMKATTAPRLTRATTSCSSITRCWALMPTRALRPILVSLRFITTLREPLVKSARPSLPQHSVRSTLSTLTCKLRSRLTSGVHSACRSTSRANS